HLSRLRPRPVEAGVVGGVGVGAVGVAERRIEQLVVGLDVLLNRLLLHRVEQVLVLGPELCLLLRAHPCPLGSSTLAPLRRRGFGQRGELLVREPLRRLPVVVGVLLACVRVAASSACRVLSGTNCSRIASGDGSIETCAHAGVVPVTAAVCCWMFALGCGGAGHLTRWSNRGACSGFLRTAPLRFAFRG